ncbi:hypothetical protein [Kitasatospora camelliae]|uniref:Uncharacterized protein n=1 Tax=Kitasatospora camelliae TaxID=3156397 RepID=A0AAU8JTA2_9ACTN
MAHQLRAEYGPAGRTGGVVKWHVVRDGNPTEGMCGADIDPDAESKPEHLWGTGLRTCQQCGSLYIHEVPYLRVDQG